MKKKALLIKLRTVRNSDKLPEEFKPIIDSAITAIEKTNIKQLNNVLKNELK